MTDDLPLADAASCLLETTAKLTAAELIPAWRKRPARVPDVVPVVSVALRTDMGVRRTNNEDKGEIFVPDSPEHLADRGTLVVVADGMGGHADGQVASELAIKTVLTGYYDSLTEEPGTALAEAMLMANQEVHRRAIAMHASNGMGTTFTALALVQDRAVVGHVGDSRAYLLRDGTLRQVTDDHTLIGEQVRMGTVSLEEAAQSPFRHMITRSIGAMPDVEPALYLETCCEGDTWVLCSDGLIEHVGDAEISSIVAKNGPWEATRQLVALACARGGHDNITVLVARVDGLTRWQAQPTKPEET